MIFLLNQTPLHQASYFGKEDIIIYLVENGADINVRSNEGNTILHLATESGNIEIIKKFLSIGIDPNIKNKV